MGIGFVLGPLLGGVLAEYGTRAPFYLPGTPFLLSAMLTVICIVIFVGACKQTSPTKAD